MLRVGSFVAFYLLLSSAGIALGLSSTASIGSNAVLSRLNSAQCALQVSVGRIPGTAMPPDWAASGAKLAFRLEVEFTNEACSDYSMTKERLLVEDSSSNPTAVFSLNDPTFISTQGQQTIDVGGEGALGIQLQNLEAQQYSLRFCLDFPKGAVRNDVELPAERIYFLWSCWIANDRVLERAEQRYNEWRKSLEETQDELRRINDSKVNIIQRAIGLRQEVLLVERKNKLETQLRELEQTYPISCFASSSSTSAKDVVEAANGLIFPKEGVIAVKRMRGTMATREQYHWVGTFAVQDFFEDDEDDLGKNVDSR